jgi:hypothetical protein
MTTGDIILHICCLVDDRLPHISRHSQARLYPSELVTIASCLLSIFDCTPYRVTAGNQMNTVRNSIKQIRLIAVVLIVALGVLACNVLTRSTEPETASTPQPVTLEAHSTTSQNDGPVEFTYDGEFNGVKYQLDLPAGFIHSTSGGWQEFCLKAPDELCVSIQPQSGTWNESEVMADEIITGFSSSVGNYQELNRRSTSTGDGFPAYSVGYTYFWQDKNIEGSRLFVVIQHVGFDIAAEGSSAMMDEYRSVIKSIVDSFRIDYN